jgi:hypothetical protein
VISREQRREWGQQGGLAKAERVRQQRAQAAREEANALAAYVGQPVAFLERLIAPETD